MLSSRSQRDYNGVRCRVANCGRQGTKLFNFFCVEHVDKERNAEFLENDAKVGRFGRNDDGNTAANHFHSGVFLIGDGRLSSFAQAQRLLELEAFFGSPDECPYIIIELQRTHFSLYRGTAAGDLGASMMFKVGPRFCKYVVVNPLNRHEVDFVVSLCSSIDNQYCEGVCFQEEGKGLCPTWLRAYAESTARLDTPKRHLQLERQTYHWSRPLPASSYVYYYNARGEPRRHTAQFIDKKRRERAQIEAEERETKKREVASCTIQ